MTTVAVPVGQIVVVVAGQSKVANKTENPVVVVYTQ